MSTDEFEGASDEQLVTCFCETRDQRCFEALFSRHQKFVYRICCSMLRDPDRAEDCTQTTFVRCFRSIDSFRGTMVPGSFARWLRRIAISVCLTELKGDPFKPTSTEAISDAGEPSHHKNPMEREDVLRVLETLSPPQRQALKMKYIDGYSYHEISAALNVDHSHVRSLIQNGKRMFRIEWKRRREADSARGETAH